MNLAIVTGGSKGLGRSLVEGLQKTENWCVYELSRSGKFHHSFNCDLGDIGSVQDTFELLFSEVAGQDWSDVVFISNAGNLGSTTLTSDIHPSDIQRSITINQISTFIFISKFMSTFRQLENRKTIVNISSGAALKGCPGWSQYCASKAACENDINAIAVEEENQAFPFVAINYDPYDMDAAMQTTTRRSNEPDFPSVQRFIDYKKDQEFLETKFVANDLIKKIINGMDTHVSILS